MFKTIKQNLIELKKDVLYFFDAEKPDFDSMETIHRDKNAPVEAPVVYIAKSGPRIKYKRR